MRTSRWRIIALFGLLFVLFVSCTQAQETVPVGSIRDDEFEEEVYTRLEAIDPDAVVVFQDATASMDAEDMETAKAEFERVLELAPKFPDALRRLSFVELNLGNVPEALELAQQAYDIKKSANNRTALAAAMSATNNPNQIRLALNFARAAVEMEPDSGYNNVVLLDIALKVGDLESVRMASTNMLEISPESPLPHYFLGVIAAQDGEWEKAESDLLLAQELGMAETQVQAAFEQFDLANHAQQARQKRWMLWGVYTLGALGVLLLLYALIRLVVNRRRASLTEDDIV